MISPEQQEPFEQSLDRKELAVQLREAGIDVDFEDWDGLDDGELALLIQRVNGVSLDVNELKTEEQTDEV